MKHTPKSLREFASALRTNPAADDSYILWILNKVSAADVLDLHDVTQGRIRVNRRVEECTENGVVAVIEGGMDCDCSAYEGHVHTFPAKLSEFWDRIDKMYYDAEGPIHWYVERPSVALNVESSSRDLALEAFENGHQHVVYY